mmetsp:Transcript_48181/g.65613  ORF Transcript_48181/g.65613 Transcript_48181/m.65613 type:complete len:761 (-) Transcript_48181:297-2579(-)|eukprot:CAMPEP_0185747028 /NCGR_PEP_ID=MMETSP1174-20130828/5711_1 /TAXON_ID=35687 /ORGANISM="Dictyocha speculum, Strain CCMP1381" /LENGTH=760 /DNA_ID=CAMNT_0028422049 /DNA_START=86 /DNA_END=2368 /DNA_ORIENTATION=-
MAVSRRILTCSSCAVKTVFVGNKGTAPKISTGGNLVLSSKSAKVMMLILLAYCLPFSPEFHEGDPDEDYIPITGEKSNMHFASELASTSVLGSAKSESSWLTRYEQARLQLEQHNKTPPKKTVPGEENFEHVHPVTTAPNHVDNPDGGVNEVSDRIELFPPATNRHTAYRRQRHRGHAKRKMRAELLKILRMAETHLSQNRLPVWQSSRMDLSSETVSDKHDITCHYSDLSWRLPPKGANEKGISMDIPSHCTALNLYAAQLGDSGAKVLAEALWRSPQIRAVDLTRNGIKQTGARALANALSHFSMLTHLDLSSNEIGDQGAVALADVIMTGSGQLRQLVLHNNGIGDRGLSALGMALLRGADTLEDLLMINNLGTILGVEALALALASPRSRLRNLNLSHNRLGNAGVAALARGLRHNSELVNLHLSGNGISDQGAVELAEALAHHTNLMRLYLTDNLIGDIGARALSQSTSQGLVTLGLVGNLGLSARVVGVLRESEAEKVRARKKASRRCLISDLTYWDEKQAWGIIQDPFSMRMLIPFECTELDLGSTDLGDDGAELVAAALHGNRRVVLLDLMSNGIGDRGAAALARTLVADDNVLEVLDLYANRIGDEGSAALARALRNNTSLSVLDLWDNKVGDRGASALGDLLKENGHLRELHLCWNEIGDAGAMALGEALENNSALTRLNLWDNMIGDEGAIALAMGLEANTALRDLNLDENDVNEDLLACIRSQLLPVTSDETVSSCESLETPETSCNS